MLPTAGPQDWTPSADELRAVACCLGKFLPAYGGALDREELQQRMLIALWRSAQVRAEKRRNVFGGAWQACENAVYDALRECLGRGEPRHWEAMLHDPEGQRHCGIDRSGGDQPDHIVSERQAIERAERILRPHEKRALLAVVHADSTAEAAAQVGVTPAAITMALDRAARRLLLDEPPTAQARQERRLALEAEACGLWRRIGMERRLAGVNPGVNR